MTWGQTAIWDVLRWLPANDTSLNLTVTHPVHGTHGVASAAAALSALLERHEALRTLFRDEDGAGAGAGTANGRGTRPVQQVRADGELPIAVVESTPAGAQQAARACAARLRAEPFDTAADLPVRAAVVVAGPRVTHIVLVFSHMAVDGWSAAIVLDDLAALLDGTPGPPAQQPRERARWERSPAGLRRSAAALRHWSRNAGELPADWMQDVRAGAGPDASWADQTSPAMAAAAHSLAARHRVAPGLVLLGSVVLLLGLYRERTAVGVRLLVATRFRPENRRLVGAFNQNALLSTELVDEPFSAFLLRLRPDSLRAYRASECDPREAEAAVRSAMGRRGFTSGGNCFYNDARYHEDGTPVPGALTGLNADQVREMLPRSRVAEAVPKGDQYASKFFLWLYGLADTARLSVCADRRFLAAGRTASDFLTDLEWLLVEALDGDPALPALRTAFADRRARVGPGAG
ncbi:condensation domain-containing protein [Streptomyces sp. SL13]|uniref:Condensation domain-containing protein n=1 Tax=Streptantibioticus silvisoli TaxID=2705255 RepID=A0AA90H5F5_9ACTN|nr:condensation domain-containing protein [Streptantibioticus silvisoli]MDI5970984.1 condensation domain-containing protein [Streptantibioticus silvisoli]